MCLAQGPQRSEFVMFSQMNRTLCLANCADPDQTANHAPSNLDQHCLSISQNKGWLTRSIQGQVNFVFFPWSRYKKHLNTFLPDSRFSELPRPPTHPPI